MKRKNLILIIISVIAVTIISGVVFTKISQAGDKTSVNPNFTPVSSASSGAIILDDSDNNSGDFTYIPPTLEADNPFDDSEGMIPEVEEEIEEPFIPNREMDLDPTSITVFVNKEHSIPKDYRPKNMVVPNIYFDFTFLDERTLMRPEAAVALEKLFNAAKAEGYILSGISGFRSYERQYKIFTNNIITKGKEHTLKYSAVPGTSEHQTGLAIDVSAESLDHKLSSFLSKKPEGIWLAENAHRYGYIIRYPKGKASITGYAFEPWHIRYVGKGLAKYLYENELTLDEYYNYKPSKDFDFETLYADLINYVDPNATIIPIEGEVVVVGENGEIIEGGLDGIEIIEGEDGDIPNDENSEEPVNNDPTDLPLEEGEVTPLPEDDETEDGEVDPADPEDENSDPTEEAPTEEEPTGDGATNGSEGSPTPTVTPVPEDINSSGIVTPTVTPTSDDTVIN